MATDIKTNILLKNVRFSFVHVYKPTKYKETDEPKYSATLLLPKDHPQIKDINKIIEALKPECAKKTKSGKLPKDFENPLRDGDDKEYDGYADQFYLAAKSKTKPGVIDRAKNPITEESDQFYSGCYGHVTVNFYAYSDGAGIAVGLNNIMKIKDGERFAGGASAEEDFKDIDLDDDDLDDDDLDDDLD